MGEIFLARKHFDKFTSKVSPCYENNMKSYIALIWDSLADSGDLVARENAFLYDHNFPA